MTTISNATGTKKVNINTFTFFTQYIQMVNTGIGTDEQVLQSKTFSTLKAANKWANKVLGL